MKIRERRRAASDQSLHRVEKVPDGMLAPYLDTAVMSLGQALDSWRFHDAPRREVDTALDAVLALWTEVDKRGLGHD
jgi:hypothetical protein